MIAFSKVLLSEEGEISFELCYNYFNIGPLLKLTSTLRQACSDISGIAYKVLQESDTAEKKRDLSFLMAMRDKITDFTTYEMKLHPFAKQQMEDFPDELKKFMESMESGDHGSHANLSQKWQKGQNKTIFDGFNDYGYDSSDCLTYFFSSNECHVW